MFDGIIQRKAGDEVECVNLVRVEEVVNFRQENQVAKGQSQERNWGRHVREKVFPVEEQIMTY